jgi:hypothetical protein
MSVSLDVSSPSLAEIPDFPLRQEKFSIQSKEESPSYTIIERIFRICVFQFSVYAYGLLEKGIMRLFQMARKSEWFPDMFNEKRAQRSLDLFKSLGAKQHFVATADGKANIHMITLQAQDLENKLHSYGARWEKMTVVSDVYKEPKEVIAIVPPVQLETKIDGLSWEMFEKQVLAKFSWKRERVGMTDGSEQDVIVTCDSASAVNTEGDKQCFLYCHSPGGPFIRDRQRAGFYLGMKQDVCFFDHRGSWLSTGSPSEAGYYLDIEAVYQKMIEVGSYRPSQVWAVGFCGGSPIAAHLKSKYHHEGMNFVEEQGFSDLRKDMLDHQPWPARWLAYFALDALKSRDISDACPQKPHEDYFNTEEKWSRLSPYQGIGGKVILIHASNDTTLGKDAPDRFLELARRVSRKVGSLFFSSPEGTDGHNASFFEYETARRQFIEMVFKA